MKSPEDKNVTQLRTWLRDLADIFAALQSTIEPTTSILRKDGFLNKLENWFHQLQDVSEVIFLFTSALEGVLSHNSNFLKWFSFREVTTVTFQDSQYKHYDRTHKDENCIVTLQFFETGSSTNIQQLVNG